MTGICACPSQTYQSGRLWQVGGGVEKRIKDEEGSNQKTKQKLYFTKIDSKSVPRNLEYEYINSLNSTFQEQIEGKRERKYSLFFISCHIFLYFSYFVTSVHLKYTIL